MVHAMLSPSDVYVQPGYTYLSIYLPIFLLVHLVTVNFILVLIVNPDFREGIHLP